MSNKQMSLFEAVVVWLIRHWPVTVAFVASWYITDYALQSYSLSSAQKWIIWTILIGGAFWFDSQIIQKKKVQSVKKKGTGTGRIGDFAEIYRLEADPLALEQIVGLQEAKKALIDAFHIILGETEEAQSLRRYGVKPPRGILLHGPPGTGKTSFARAAAQYFGCNFIVVNASSVAGMYVGQTEKNIRSVFETAVSNTPCVIFFDEFDAIAKKRGGSQAGNSPSELAINTLLTCLDGFKQVQSVIVMAATNRLDIIDPALTRPGRFDIKVEVGLPDLQARQELFILFLRGRPLSLISEDVERISKQTEGLSPAEIQAICNEAARDASKEQRLINLHFLQRAVKKITSKEQVEVRPVEEVWREINDLIGLEPVKAFLKEIEAVARANKQRVEQGLPPLQQSYHMCFTGNPGTGKTTIARLVGELLASLEVLPSGHLVETDRSGLVAGYVGQTAIKTQDMIEKALGGVLFVDEAYSLARGGPQDFGGEALDTLIKAIEDHRDKLVVIFAGYTNEMKELFKLNPGLDSRVAFTCEFPDYTVSELLRIAHLEAKKQMFKIDIDAEKYLYEHFQAIDAGKAGNGRYARRLIESGIRQAVKAGRSNILTKEDF